MLNTQLTVFLKCTKQNQPDKPKTRTAAVHILCSLVCYPVSKLKDCAPLPPTPTSVIIEARPKSAPPDIPHEDIKSRGKLLRARELTKKMKKSRKRKSKEHTKQLSEPIMGATTSPEENQQQQEELPHSEPQPPQTQHSQPPPPPDSPRRGFISIGIVEIPSLQNLEIIPPTRNRSAVISERSGMLDTKVHPLPYTQPSNNNAHHHHNSNKSSHC